VFDSSVEHVDVVVGTASVVWGIELEPPLDVLERFDLFPRTFD